ncbi:MAG TPA: bile acid:sodium symporter family protein [Acetobacteraceae bacterium]|nr:bile acid:sodium symporter family protein [Acetobacteraceae bacterium]
MARLLSRLPIDPYILAILSVVGLASVLPAHGEGAIAADYGTDAAIALLFFLHGARLQPEVALAGASNWRLHALVFFSTFALFPILGLAARAIAPGLLPAPLWTGVLLLCVLPSTVQSSIAFTSIARGNVAAAICSASASNLLGILLTPLLTGLLMRTQGGFSIHAIGDVVLQLLVPFVAGQLARPWLADWAGRNKTLLGLVDRGSILLVVYAAFSEGVTHGIWHQLDLSLFGILMLLNAALLATVLATTAGLSRLLGFSREDRITVVFCGSKKSLAAGLPMASVLFASQPVGLIVLPLMLFHQIQLMACAALARRYAAEPQLPATVPDAATRKSARFAGRTAPNTAA